jgi:hypothetical protein
MLHIVKRMRSSPVIACLLLAGAVGFACGSSGDGSGGGTVTDAGGQAPDVGMPVPEDAGAIILPMDAGTPAQDSGDAAVSPPGPSKIEHVVVIVQENHTFDTYFGRYCTAPAGSNPSCTSGPACCEAAPDTDPSGSSPVTLDDNQNGAHDPDHSQACELSEMNGGAMDRYTKGAACSNAGNFAIAPASIVQKYLDYASSYAIADRYFQPIVGQTSSNDMYFAAAKYVFTDNAYEPAATGHGCANPLVGTITYKGQLTSADVVLNAGATFADYAVGFDAMYRSSPAPRRRRTARSAFPRCRVSTTQVTYRSSTTSSSRTTTRT